MAKVTQIDIGSATDEIKTSWNRLLNSRKDVQTPLEMYGFLAYNPLLMEGWSALAQSLRGYRPDGQKVEISGSLEPRLYHLTKLQVAHLTQNHYEWVGHLRSAKKYGINESEINALKEGNTHLFSLKEQILLNYISDLVVQNNTEVTLGKMAELFSNQQIVEATVTASFYVCIARFVNALKIKRLD